MSKAQKPGTLASQRAVWVILPGILTTHFMLTLLLTLVGTLIPGDRLFLVCYNDDDMMWAFKLKEDQHLSIPPSPSLSLSLSVSLSSVFCLSISVLISLPLYISLCLPVSQAFVSVSLGLSLHFSLDLTLNSLSLYLFVSFCLSCAPLPPTSTFPISQALPWHSMTS